jgi:hypothetical protein
MPEFHDELRPMEPVEIVPTPEAQTVIGERGGLLFIRPKVMRGLMGNMTVLRTSTEVPPDALDYRRVEVGGILVFLSPRMRRLPKRLDLDARGRRRQIRAYWDGCEYAA